MKRPLLILAPAISGLCIFFAVLHTNFLLAWVALTPLFLRAKIFLPALIAGVIFSVCSFAWIIPGAHAFTGASIGYGIAIFLLCVIVFAAGFAGLCWISTRIRHVLYVASVWVLVEWLLHYVSKGMPWFLFHMGNALSDNLYAIQSASLTGVYGMSFIVVSVNWLVARAIAGRKWKMLVLPAGVFVMFMLLGWMLLGAWDRAQAGAPGFTIALLSENIPPDIQWDTSNGDRLVQQLLSQENACIAQHPQLILWPESAIPWTYTQDDDLVRELLHRSAPSGITHVLGMNTAVSDKLVYNSAYCLTSAGTVMGRYDKRLPLLLVEQPWNGWLIPFFSAGGYAVSPGTTDLPLPTPYGKAGIMICNESALPETAAASVSHGARFLLNMSNDGWFSDTYLVHMHFYNARLRAVETRKDIAINSNNGLSGFVSASGRIDDASYASMYPNDIRTVAVSYPCLPVYLCIFLLLSAITIHLKTKLS